MLDVCLVVEGGYPACVGGLSTWTHRTIQALGGLDVAVHVLGPQVDSPSRFSTDGVSVLTESFTPTEVPVARRYIAAGLTAAELLLVNWKIDPAKVSYVEHGDAVAEVLSGAMFTESGRPVQTTDRLANARAISMRRERIAKACGQTVCVSRRAAERHRRKGVQNVALIENAVQPVERPPARGSRIGFVGRLTREKGFDRFLELSSFVSAELIARGPKADAQPNLLESQCVSIELDCEDPWVETPTALGMPSRLDACPFVALEAEARGIPVLMTPVADIAPSPLLHTRNWHPRTWARVLTELSEEPNAHHLGQQIATRRWETFTSKWQAVARAE